MLPSQWVGGIDAREMLGRKPGNPLELEISGLRERIPDAEYAAIDDTDHVSRPRLLDAVALASHELLCRREAHGLAGPDVLHLDAGLEMAGTDAHEGNAIAVTRVHVRLDLEHEAGELGAGGLDGADARLSRRGRRRQRRKSWRKASTPKLVSALPKCTGVMLPSSNAS